MDNPEVRRISLISLAYGSENAANSLYELRNEIM